MERTKTVNVIRSTATGIANSLIILLLNLISQKLFLQYIGIEYLSVAQVITNLLVVLSFTELGLSHSVTYMLYEPVASDNREEICRILHLYRKFNRYVGCIIGIVGLFFMPFLHLFIKTGIDIYMIYIIYLLNLFTSVSSYFYSYRNVLLGAHQKDYVSSIISTAVSLGRVIIQCFLIYITHSYLVFLIVGLCASIIQNAIIYFLTGKMYPYIRRSNIKEYDQRIQNTKQKLIHNMASMVSVKIAGIVINNTDNILTSWINTILVGICANYLTISTMIKSLINIFHQALLHSVGIASIEKTNLEKYKLFKKVLLVNTFIVGIISVCLGTLWNDFIVLWIGNKYLLDPLIYISLLLNFIWALLTSPIWIFRDANGLFVYVKNMLLVNAVLNLVFSLILGKFLGVAGVFFGTIVADLFTDFWYDSNIIFQKVFQKRWALSYHLYIFENVLVIWGIVWLISYLARAWEINIIFWIIKGALTASIYIIWFFLRNRHSDEYHDVKDNMVIPYLKVIIGKIFRKRDKNI